LPATSGGGEHHFETLKPRVVVASNVPATGHCECEYPEEPHMQWPVESMMMPGVRRIPSIPGPREPRCRPGQAWRPGILGAGTGRSVPPLGRIFQETATEPASEPAGAPPHLLACSLTMDRTNQSPSVPLSRRGLLTRTLRPRLGRPKSRLIWIDSGIPA
jgi:hypothetical protein